MSVKNGKLIYHLVPLDSLESIIRYGLRSRDDLKEIGINFIDTADQEILHEREMLGLSQYIPFHFHIHTAYDTAVKNKNIQRTFIYICLHRDFARNNGFKILPIHPASNEQPELYEYDDGFEAIDWQTMELKIPEAQSCGIDLRYHKQVRMAECLAISPISVEFIQSIIVPDEETRDYVLSLFESFSVNTIPYVNVRNWFVN